MKKRIALNGYLYEIFDIRTNVFKIVEFENDKSGIEFTLSSELSGFDNILPSYKPVDKNQELPQRILDIIPVISDIIKENK